METEGRVTGDVSESPSETGLIRCHRHNTLKGETERWNLGHVRLQTQMLICLLGRKERNKEETGPKVIVKTADFLLQTGLFWPVNPSGLNVSSLLFILFLLYI